MRISLTELHRPKTITLKGDEEWLARLHSDFPLGSERRLTGTLKLEIGIGGEVNVTGKVEFTPMVSCSRCVKSIAWPLALDVSTRFMVARGLETKKEITLTEADLDTYFIVEGGIDLEQMMTDLVQTALPMQLVPMNEDETSCLVCHDDLTRELVYGVEEKKAEKPASPFAALKDLKLKH